MTKHTEIGTNGELIAVNFLKNTGYDILHCNWRYGKKEIDIIAESPDFIVFIEVKTRSSFDFGYPEEAVTKNKKEFMKLAAQAYYEEFEPSKHLRFDIISILWHHGKANEVVHLIDAFY